MHVARLIMPILIGAAAVGAALPAQSAPGGLPVVINEVDTRGPGGGNDEFIELYNPAPVAVDISGWALYRSNGSDTTLTSQIDLTDAAGLVIGDGSFPAGTTIPAGGFRIIANRAAGGYTGVYDFEYRFGMTDHTGVILAIPVRDPLTGTIVKNPVDNTDLFVPVDSVGFSGTTLTNDATSVLWAINSGSNDNWTASRLNANLAGCNPVNTGVNRADFRLRPRTPGACNDTPLVPTTADLLATASVKLSEVDTSGLGAGTGSGNDEFIELHNNTPDSFLLDGWTLWRCNSSDTDLVSEIVLAGSLGVIPASGTIYVNHALWTAPAGVPAAAATYSVGVSDGTGVILTNSQGVVVDSVGFSGDVTNSACVEAVAAASAPANAADSSARRGVAGLSVDTNVNAADWEVVPGRTPGA